MEQALGMKQLVVYRHAKTERDHPLGDWHRRLTERGQRDARASAAAIGAMIETLDLIVTSDAVRALATAELLVESLDWSGAVVPRPSLYLANLEDLVSAVRSLPDKAESVVLVGHNPGLLELIDWLTGAGEGVEHLPTAGFAVVTAEIEAWPDIDLDATQVSPVFSP
jgi:phosphohistidine phosphatase